MFIAIGLTVALGYANDDQETAPAEGSTAASFPCGRQYNEFVLLHQTNDDPSVFVMNAIVKLQCRYFPNNRINLEVEDLGYPSVDGFIGMDVEGHCFYGKIVDADEWGYDDKLAVWEVMFVRGVEAVFDAFAKRDGEVFFVTDKRGGQPGPQTPPPYVPILPPLPLNSDFNANEFYAGYRDGLELSLANATPIMHDSLPLLMFFVARPPRRLSAPLPQSGEAYEAGMKAGFAAAPDELDRWLKHILLWMQRRPNAGIIVKPKRY